MQRKYSKNQNDFAYNFNSNFVEETNLSERYQNFRKIEMNSLKSSKQNHYRILTQGLHASALEIDDKAASAFGLEVRYPFWDKRLVEFCFSLPAEQKLAKGWSRVVMRRAMEGILPSAVQWRTSKTDFTPNLKKGLFVEEKEVLERLLFEESAILEKYVNIESLREKYYRGTDVQFIWRVVSLGLWLNSTSTNNLSKYSKTYEESSTP